MISNNLRGLVVDRAGVKFPNIASHLVWQQNPMVLLKSLGNLPRLANQKTARREAATSQPGLASER